MKLGEVQAALGKFKESASAYQEAIRRTPLLAPEYLFSGGEVLIQSGDLTKAEQHAAVLMKEHPANAHELMARIALARNDLKNAEREAQLSAASSRGLDPKRLLLVAEVFQRQERFNEALNVLDSAEGKAKSAGLGTLHRLDFLRGDTLARMNRFDEAEAAYRREIASFPASGRAYANLAILYLVQGKAREADKVFEVLVARYPSEANYLLAAKTYEVVEDVATAREWRTRMQQLR